MVEVAHEFEVTRETLYNWKDSIPEFFDAFTRARLACLAWWERQGRVMLANTRELNLNFNVWRFNMVNRFPDDWKDVNKTEITGKDGAPLHRSAKDVPDDEIVAILTKRGVLDGQSRTRN